VSEPAVPRLLLRLTGRALLAGAGQGPLRLAEAVWADWSRSAAEAARRAELLTLATAPAEAVRQALVEETNDLAKGRPDDRRALAEGLAGLVRALRRAARSAPPEVRRAADLVPFLPAPPAAPTEAPADGPSVTLHVTEGPHAGRTFTFTRHDTFLVGRSRQAHFALAEKDMYFSRTHFLVEANPPHCRLTDLGSRNGTLVNGARVTAIDLRHGDRIQAGHTVLEVQVHEGPTLAVEPVIDLGAATVGVTGAPCRVCNPSGEAAALPVCPACQERLAAGLGPVAGFTVERELGRGGMGVVYLARRTSDGARLAVKTIVPSLAGSPEQVERFLREAEVLRELDHPHVVGFREMGEAGGLLYFAMDYVAGTDAARLLAERGPLPVPLAVGLVCQVLQALDYAHAKRFVHRDVKPANVLVARVEGEPHAFLADFGLARVYQASQLSGLTMTGTAGGTPCFMAPEQVTNYRDARPPADLFATAATLYNLLTGRLIHDPAPTIHDRLLQVLNEDAVPIQERRPDLPDGLASAVHRALARAPEKRFADAKAFRRALRPYE
jgi:serine/threonine-protein kinase